MAQLESLMQRNFLEYSSYFVLDRAIPDIRDGLKPVQRRILHTLFSVNDGRFHKVANVIGETMKLHPHGDASIGDALVVLANKDFFIEKQGNFGNLLFINFGKRLALENDEDPRKQFFKLMNMRSISIEQHELEHL